MTRADQRPDGIPQAAVEAFDAGMLSFIEDDTETAALSFAAAVEAHPAFDDAHYMLALAKLRLGGTDEAIVHLRTVVAASDNVMLRDYAARKLESLGADHTREGGGR